MFARKKWTSLFALVMIASMVLSACAPPTPQIIEKEVLVEKKVVETVIVEKEVVVEKPVVETVVVEKEVLVEKKVVETVVVEKEVKVKVEVEVTKIVEKIVPALPDIPRGGTVVICQGPEGSWARNFNPFAPNPVHPTFSFIFEPLILWNPVEGGAPTYWLATAHEYADDLLSITFTLRDGVRWSDGEEFNADDVVFTANMLKEFPALDRGAIWEYTESVEKVNDLAVRFNLKDIYTQADTTLGRSNIVPEHIWSQIEDPVTFTNDNPVATGPFTEVESFSEEVFTVCRNPYYWQEGRPYIDCIRYPAYTGNDPANLALINDELDWAGNFIPDIEKTYVAQDPEHHFYYFWPGGGTVQLYALTTKAPFDDPVFRRAMSMAIDYDSVVEIGMYGYTIPANATGIGPAHESWLNQEALDLAAEMGLGKCDPDAAAAVLDEAGYVDADGDGFRDMPDGSPIEFKVQVVNGWTDWVTSVQIMSQNFQDIGLNARIDTLEFGAWLDNLLNGTYDTSIGWSTSGRTPWDFYRNILDSSLISEEGEAMAQLWGRWTSDEADALIDDFVATADLDEQEAIIDQLQMIYVENIVAIPLFPGPTWYEYNTVRFTGFPTKENYYAQGSPWADEAQLIVVTRIHCVDHTSCGQE